ncbi:MAG: MFS transporter [Planctomycetota bacterium]
MAQEITSAERRRGMNISIWDGAYATIHGNLVGGLFITYYIIALGATNIHYGLMGAIPSFAVIIQLLIAYWLQSLPHRKPLTVVTVVIVRFCWFLIPFIPFFFIKPVSMKIFFWLYLIACIYGAMAGIPWTSWMADLVPAPVRGRYFSRRAMVCTIVSSIGLLGGLYYDYSKPINDFITDLLPTIKFLTRAETLEFVKIGVLSLLGTAAGVLSIIYLLRQPEPPYVKKDTVRKPIPIFTYARIALADKNFRTFTILMCIWSIVNGISGPFWTPFLINKIKWSATTIQFYGFLALIFRVIALPVWGKLIDRYGNKPIIMVAIYFGAFHPLYWVISDANCNFFIYIDGISSGIMWAGVEIAVLKLMLGSSPDKYKEMYYAVYTVLTGLTVAFPQIFIGWIADMVPANFRFLSLDFVQWVFWLVAIGRFLFLIPFMKLVTDPGSKTMLYFLDNIMSDSIMGRATKDIFGFIGIVTVDKKDQPASAINEKEKDLPPDKN